jgi:hypothetical protein
MRTNKCDDDAVIYSRLPEVRRIYHTVRETAGVAAAVLEKRR